MSRVCPWLGICCGSVARRLVGLWYYCWCTVERVDHGIDSQMFPVNFEPSTEISMDVMRTTTAIRSSSFGGSPSSSSPSSSSSSHSSSATTDLPKDAFSKHQFVKCAELLKKALDETEGEPERRRLHANLALCEAKSKGQIYSAAYCAALLTVFPKLKPGEDHSLDSHDEAVAGFNVALNAFVRGNRRTCLEILQSVMATHSLSDTLFCAVSLLEIEVSLTLCQPKLALKQTMRLRDSQIWRRASFIHRDYLDSLECRIRFRLAQTSPLIDFSSKPELLHWCLILSELDMKNGNATRAVNRLLKFRPSPQDEERRLVDNALGCVYGLSLKKMNLAESYFRSAMLNGNNSMETNGRLGEMVGTAHNGYIIMPSFSYRGDNLSNEISEVGENEISWEYAALCIRNALILTGTERDCVYLLPWLYAASSFINLNLGRYGLALKAACQLASLQQVSPHHKLMAVLFKAEALLLLDRLPEAVGCLTQAVPLQSMPSTISAVIYNRALLQALSGNFHKSLTTFGLLGTQCDVTTSVPEAVSLGVYINMKLNKGDDVRRLLTGQIQQMRLS
uniref:CCR4-NOT transcription complex subunit 10 n=1 Tax=Setaria digitata TaxID=48799 RepID=A0A915Q1S6_9BILA